MKSFPRNQPVKFSTLFQWLHLSPSHYPYRPDVFIIVMTVTMCRLWLSVKGSADWSHAMSALWVGGRRENSIPNAHVTSRYIIDYLHCRYWSCAWLLAAFGLDHGLSKSFKLRPRRICSMSNCPTSNSGPFIISQLFSSCVGSLFINSPSLHSALGAEEMV